MERIGFIGLGIMGKPMAINLLRAGYPLTFHDIRPEAQAEVAAAGGTPTESAAEVARNSDVVITILPDSPQVLEVVLGGGGVIEGVRKGMLYIDMSSIVSSTSKDLYEKLAAKGVAAIDAPVSGGQPGAEQGTLSIMVGGDEAAVQRAMPIFEVLGKTINHVGGPGAGQITKTCNQICVASITQGVIEALTVARKAGVDPAKVHAALNGGFAKCKVLDISGNKMLARDFEPGFKLNLYRKDLRIALETGEQLGVTLPGATHSASWMDILIEQGKGELDFSALLQVIEEKSSLSQG